MCGIAGIVAPAIEPAARETALAPMLDRQLHRGPDDLGRFSDGPATLGMRRLAIIDPANGRQPMQTADGRFTLVFNGAIYNYRELQAELRAAGENFRTNCDTEVLLVLFARHGPACLSRLRGMFAFAVWDAHQRTLFAARDALGIKPLYYARLAAGGMVFASELNALFASGLVSRAIDATSVGEYLAWFSVPAPRTIYEGVTNLPPGHSLTVEGDGRVTTGTWWRLPTARATGAATNYSDFVHGLRAQLEDSIRAHRVADVPVGAFLSGGLDSTAIAGLMTRTGATRLKTFSVVFEEKEYSEQSSARLAAQALGTEHHEELLTGSRLAADLPRILASYDQPTGDGINTYYASLAARTGGVTVALSGLGGDELFGGYPSFRDLPRLNRILPAWRSLPRSLRNFVLDRLRASPAARQQKLADFLTHARDLHDLGSLQRRVLSESARLALLNPDARRAALRLGPQHPLLDDFVAELAGADDFQIISAGELRTYMTDVLLRDSDVFSMAHSLELRVPFVDVPLLSWLWPQRADLKHRTGSTKRALADATADIVPAEIRQRAKQGFTLPYAKWMRAELRPFLDETFSTASLANCPWLDAAAVQEKWRTFLGGNDPRSWSRVWTVAMLIAFANRRP
ncbi:MAG TPA: asparagine synthase (glutamine-hydrolyzing) [Candidatus Didemnitutus sp.]|nr:asparagine synthase (glutamine-hydrolyzing) [Candidatus Didemnitutus sp.]